ncbi:hypothetical protein ACMYUJ_00045 [Stutzerimonas zhaodongensis]|uniref:hypothetical protein n=1 Tax=Stutzerimonas zhaodongensis TaxID=1176257 RepID=UPI0039F0A3CA
MKADAVVQLQQLRHLRERRVQNQLASQAERCMAATARLHRAQEAIDQAKQQLQREAEALQQLLGTGALAAGTCQAALEVLDALDQHRLYLHEQLLSAEQNSAAEQQRKAALQHALMLRRQQSDALEPLLDEHARAKRRVDESIEEDLYDERAALRWEAPQ